MARSRNQLRIVAGEHGGRRLRFPDVTGLRPTAEKVRETLFNWLQGQVRGAKVLDLFAGSGALGFEALSRGAADVVFVERSRPACAYLRDSIALLRAGEKASVVQTDARRWLQHNQDAFDLVFLDPPFADRLLPELVNRLCQGGQLAENAWLYLEQDASEPWPALPAELQLFREGVSGQAAFRLMHRIGCGDINR